MYFWSGSGIVRRCIRPAVHVGYADGSSKRVQAVLGNKVGAGMMPRTVNYITTFSAVITGMIGLYGLATMSGAKLLVYAALLAMAAIVLWSELRGVSRAVIDAQRSVTFDNGTLTYETADATHVVQVADIKCIDIITTDRGPFEDDMFWHIETGGGVIVIPSAADHTNALFDMLGQLGNADYIAMMEAGGCVVNAAFSVWSASDHTPV